MLFQRHSGAVCLVCTPVLAHLGLRQQATVCLFTRICLILDLYRHFLRRELAFIQHSIEARNLLVHRVSNSQDSPASLQVSNCLWSPSKICDWPMCGTPISSLSALAV
ncbi:unnamed protein product [Protopolystoma xenopodis]|uniref:Secreted protein n=1 Tax=Protopolystoma xenopodis TaxID=117903 RepID=A0A448XK60_9PLAT|nr:unnamed protein product [Protopolystoma xenopodis]